VFSICGDGGFLMSGNDLVTAVKHGAPVTFVIMNDRRLNMVHHGLTEQYGAAPDCTIGDVDFAQMANAFGAKGFVARTIDDVMAALRIRTGVVVIDARIDPDARLPKNARVAALKQFTE
jgi:acetolactate synthase-1/2/3 large subunit